MKLSKEKLMEKEYITCDECGYNNKKKGFEAFGTCLRCGNILDDKIYFKAQLFKISMRKSRTQGKHTTQRNLPF